MSLGVAAAVGLGMMVGGLLLAPDPPVRYGPDLPGRLIAEYNEAHGLEATATSSTGPAYLRALAYRYQLPPTTDHNGFRRFGRTVDAVGVQRGEERRFLTFAELESLVGAGEGFDDPETAYDAGLGLGVAGIFSLVAGIVFTIVGYLPADRSPAYFAVGNGLTVLGLALVSAGYVPLYGPAPMQERFDAQIAPYNQRLYESRPPDQGI